MGGLRIRVMTIWGIGLRKRHKMPGDDTSLDIDVTKRGLSLIVGLLMVIRAHSYLERGVLTGVFIRI